MTYSAFISYKTDTDAVFAKEVQDGLQYFAKPWNKLRAINVFRDLRSLEPTSNLPTSLEKALLESEFLLLMASPGAVTSQWVSKELTFWLKHKGISKLLLVHTGGNIVWDDASNDFDWLKTNALPPVLQHAFTGQPFITSLIDPDVTADLSLNNDAFKEKIAGLSSTIRGLEKEDLYGLDVEAHAKAKRYRNMAVAGLVSLAVGVAITAGLAYKNALDEEDQRLSTFGERAARLSSKPGAELDALVAGLFSTNRQFGGDRALPQDAVLGLFASVAAANRSIILDADDEAVTHAEFSPDGTKVLTAGMSGTVRLWRADTGAPIRQLYGTPDGQPIWSANYSPDGKFIATSTATGSVRIWDAQTDLPSRQLAANGPPVYTVNFSPNSKKVVAGSHDGRMRLWSVESGELLADRQSHESGLHIAHFSPDGNQIVTASWQSVFAPGLDGKVRIWNGRNGTWIRDLDGHQSDVRAAEFSTDGRKLATASYDTTVRVWDVKSGAQLASLNHSAEVFVAGFSNRYGRVVSAGEAGTIHAGMENTEILSGHTGPVNDMDFAKDGDVLATASGDTTVKIWSLLPGYSYEDRTFKGHSDVVTTLEWSPDETRIVSGADDGKARIWTIDPPEVKDIAKAIARGCALLGYRKMFERVKAVCNRQ